MKKSTEINEDRLEILDIKKRCFGASAFNPSTIISWQPKQKIGAMVNSGK